mgnify:FL=1
MSKAGANRKRAFMREKNMLQLYLALIDEEWDLIRFEEAYYEYKGLLHYIAKKILQDEHRAEDAVQEAFLRIAKNFHKVGNVKTTSTKNFFILITRRVCLNLLEREEKFSTATEEEISLFENSYTPGSLPDSFAGEAELIRQILNLPESMRSVLYLQAVYGFNAKETANLLGISVGAVWKRTSRARVILKKELEEK